MNFSLCLWNIETTDGLVTFVKCHPLGSNEYKERNGVYVCSVMSDSL